jgi:bacillithiol system protein YtxJ
MPPPVQTLESEHDILGLLRAPAAVLLKHSTRCPISAAARGEVERFCVDRPGAVVCLVDVNAQRELSDAIAERFQVPHDSPQAFVLVAGVPIWVASHYEIKARELAKQYARAAR